MGGPVGALVGNLVGAFVQNILSRSGVHPTAGEELKSLVSGYVQQGSASLGEKLIPPEKKRINHDLQTAFRDALAQGLVDVGGPGCFPNEWKAGRDVPEGIAYSLDPNANQLWRSGDPLAGQIAACLQDLQARVLDGSLLPLEPPVGADAADVRTFLRAETPLELTSAFYDAVIAPQLSKWSALLREVPDLAPHLRRHLLDRTLVHLSELLKERPHAWCAYTRMMLEDQRQEMRAIGSGQEQILARLDALLEASGTPAFDSWAASLADILGAFGRAEKRLDEGFGELQERLLSQHRQAMDCFTQLIEASQRIEQKVDQVSGQLNRVLRFLENGEYVIEVDGRPAAPIDLPPEPGEPPFKGLHHFEESDAGLFYGREALTERLARRLKAHPFLAVVGASGSGKSSLARAGLIPALKSGLIFDSQSWLVQILTPTSDPLAALAACLTNDLGRTQPAVNLTAELHISSETLRLAAGQQLSRCRAARLLLVVDQFEELFTQCRDEVQRQVFVDNLLAAAQPESPIYVLITLRADFYAQCGNFPALRAALVQHQEFIGPMSAAELRRAIGEPARCGGWDFERGVVELFLRDAGVSGQNETEPGALPLLSHALLETWNHRRGRTMTLESYAESGGVRGAIAKTAEAVYNRDLTPDQQTLARQIFLRLTEPGEGVPDTRRRAMLSELSVAGNNGDNGSAEKARLVLKTLTDRRLVITGDEGRGLPTVQMAHEALLREWPRLRQWLDENRAGLLVHRRISETAQEWERGGRDESLLYRGARLAEAQIYARTPGVELNPLEAEFVDASRQLAQREHMLMEEQQRRELEAARRLADETEARRRVEAQRAHEAEQSAGRLQARNRIITGIGVLALLAAVAALVFAGVGLFNWYRANQNAEQAHQQERTAYARSLAASSINNLTNNPELSVLLAMQAVGVNSDQPLPEAVDALLRSIWNLRVERTIAPGGQLTDIFLAGPDYQSAVTLGNPSGVILWDVNSEKMHLFFSGPKYNLSTIAVSPDYRTIAGSGCAAFDNQGICQGGETWVWDLENQVAEGRSFSAGLLPSVDLAFSPDSQILAAADLDGSIRLWDWQTGKLIKTLGGHTGMVNRVAFSPDSRLLASGGADRTTRLWEPEFRPGAGCPGGPQELRQCSAVQPGWRLSGDRLH
jgi:energy-coupling factor transporter ATP-binding protein EcfA2